jgi:hypothetical protein
MPASQTTSEVVILVKASPHVGKKHGETVCCAGVGDDGRWMRLYPVTFRTLDEAKQFKRWDRIRFRWEKPNDDSRPESARVDHQSIEIIGELKRKDRLSFLNRIEVSSIKKVQSAGGTFALLRPRNLKFSIEKKERKKFDAEKREFEAHAAQIDLFAKPLIPFEPCPYEFKYAYSTDDGEREGTCQDWETDATFYNWSKQYGEEGALQQMRRVFGEEYPKKGVVFAMGTHSLYPDTWLINGIIRLDEMTQLSLDL